MSTPAQPAERKPTPPLFKFRAYDGGDEGTRVRATLLDGEIYFARPPQFNDPFEARPTYVPASLNESEWRDSMRRWAMEKLSGSRAARRRAARQFSNQIDPRLEPQRDALRQDFATNAAIYSMSANREEPLLWAHYAAQYTGLCIHIDTTRPPFGVAMPVNYSPTYPTLELPRTRSDLDTFELCLHTKSEGWGYEGEYRLTRIEYAPRRSRDLGMRWHGQVATAPIDRFTAITLGPRMPDQFRAELLELAKTRSVPLEVWQAKLHETRYALEFDRIT